MSSSSSRPQTLAAKLVANERFATPGYKPLFRLPGNPTVMGMLQQGNLDLKARPLVRNGPSAFSTVDTITVTDNQGRAYLLPLVVNDKVVSPRQAVQHWQQTGQHLGIFANEAAANRYAEALHNQQASFYGV